MADVLDQSEIDALLSDAGSLAEEAGEPPGGGGGGAMGHAAAPEEMQAVELSPDLERDLGRILNLQIPVIVCLAERVMRLSEIVRFSSGSIIEFDKSSDADLDLQISNKRIGKGQAVKVGENFGLRITRISALQDKIAALGGE